MPAPGLLSQRSPQRLDSYGLGKLQDMAPLFDDIYAGARAQGLPLRTLMSEYAPGQYEITLLHRDDALRAIDDAILFKRLIRATALKHGLTACFMPKPFADQAGSGMHMHVSVQDENGNNAFAADDPAGTPLLRHAIGGLQKTMAESMLIFAPNANSYRRFRHQSYAPMAPTWGINNRSVSLRVPAGAAVEPTHRASSQRRRRKSVPGRGDRACRRACRHHRQARPRSAHHRQWLRERYRRLAAPRLAGRDQAAEDSMFLREALGEEFLRGFRRDQDPGVGQVQRAGARRQTTTGTSIAYKLRRCVSI